MGLPYVWIEDSTVFGGIPPEVDEGDDLEWTIKRENSLPEPALFGLTWSLRPGSPDYGSFIDLTEDYMLPTSVQFMANEDEVTLRVSTTDDDLWEQDVILFVCIPDAGQNHRLHVDRFGPSRNCAGFWIRDNDPPPTILPYLPDDEPFTVVEGDSVDFELLRHIPPGKNSPHMSGQLTVYVKIKELHKEDGTYFEAVIDPADPTSLGFPVTFAEGEEVAAFTYEVPDNDEHNKSRRAIALRIESDHRATSLVRPRWDLTVHNEAFVNALDDELPVVTVTPQREESLEGGLQAGIVFNRNGYLAEELTVKVSAEQVGDFLFVPFPDEITILSGSPSVVVIPGIRNDDLFEEDGSFTVTILESDAYELGSESTASITLKNDDLPQHVLVEGRQRSPIDGETDPELTEVEEGDHVSFRLTRRERSENAYQDTDTIADRGALEVNLTVSQFGDFLKGSEAIVWTPAVDGNGDVLSWSPVFVPVVDGALTATFPERAPRLWLILPTEDDRRIFGLYQPGFQERYPNSSYQLQARFQDAYEDDGSVTLTVVEGENYEHIDPERNDNHADSVTVRDNEPPLVNLTLDGAIQTQGGSSSPSIGEGSGTVDIWVTRFFDDLTVERPVPVRVRPLHCLAEDMRTYFRDLRPYESPVDKQNLTITIPAGQTRAKHTLTIVDDGHYDCDVRVFIYVDAPPNARQLPGFIQSRTFTTGDYLSWDYHPVPSQWNAGFTWFHRLYDIGVPFMTALVLPRFIDNDSPPNIGFSDRTIDEDEGEGTVGVRLTGADDRWDYTIEWETQAGTATEGDDYVASHGTAVISGEDINNRTGTATIVIPLIDDITYEGNETITLKYKVSLSLPSDDAIFILNSERLRLRELDGKTTLTIIDDEATPRFIFREVGVPEGDVTLEFPITLSNKSDETVTVDWATSDDTAVAGSDYVAASGTLTFAPGENTKLVSVDIKEDSDAEGSEQFHVVLSNPVNAQFTVVGATTADRATGRIYDTDVVAKPQLRVEPARAAENSGEAIFLISLVDPDTGNLVSSQLPASVNYVVARGLGENGATSPADFAGKSGTLAFAPGVSTQSISVSLVNDDVSEPDPEHFRLVFSGIFRVTFDETDEGYDEDELTLTVSGIITDDDPNPTISIADTELLEALHGQSHATMEFPITLDRASGVEITVRAAIGMDGTATIVDYFVLSSDSSLEILPGGHLFVYQLVTFDPGATKATAKVQIRADKIDEPPESIIMRLSHPSEHGALGVSQATGNILDNSPAPELRLRRNVRVTEGDGSATFEFQVRHPPSDTPTSSGYVIEFEYATADGNAPSSNAQAGPDYVAKTGTAVIEPGATTFEIAVNIIDDKIDEDDEESFRLILAMPSFVTFPDGGDTWEIEATIVDRSPPPGVRIENARTLESEGTIDFFVSLNRRSEHEVTVEYTVSAETATLSDDFTTGYTGTEGTVTFAPGTTLTTISVPIIDDNADEDDEETLTITLSNPTNANLRTNSATGSIVDNDPPADTGPHLVLDPIVLTITEEDPEGGRYALKLSEAPDGVVTVTIEFGDDTGLSTDKSSLVFTTTDWNTEQTVRVKAGGDADLALDTHLILHTASEAGAGNFEGAKASLPVVVNDNDEFSILVSPETLVVPEGDPDGAEYSVWLSDQPRGSVVVHNDNGKWSLLQTVPAVLTFTADNWDQPQKVTVTLNHDENGVSERVTVTHSADGGRFRGVTATSTVVANDDDIPAIVIAPPRVAVTEGDLQGSTFGVRLRSLPQGDVTVSVGADQTTRIKLQPSPLTFSSDYWDVEQYVTVTAGHDTNTATEEIPVEYGASGGSYDAARGILTVSVVDDDATGVNILPLSLTIPEGEDGSYSVVLGSQPSGEVVVAVSPPGGNQDISVMPPSLTFTVDDWDTEKMVTVSAGHDDDHLDEEEVDITHSVTGAEEYDSIVVDSVGVSITDDDEPVADVSFALETITVPEGGEVDVTINLDGSLAQPIHLPISVSGEGNASANDFEGVPTSVILSESQTKVTFTVSITDDERAEASESLILSFDNLPEQVQVPASGHATVTIQINDNDTAAVTVAPTELAVQEEMTAQYSVVLQSEPSGDVLFTIEVPAEAKFRVDRPSLKFTPANWSVEQKVTVSANPDRDGEHESALTITHTVSGADYDSIVAEGVDVAILDDDRPPLTVSFEQPIYKLFEGSDVQIKVTLSEDPTRDITVPILTKDASNPANVRSMRSDPLSYANPEEYTGVPGSVSFVAGQTEMTFSFQSVDDDSHESDKLVELAFGKQPAGVSTGPVTNSTILLLDDDEPAVTVSFEQATYTVAEGGSVTVKVTLSEDPERTVTIPISRDNQGGAGNGDYSGVPANVAFNSGDTEKTFSITATDDTIDDDDESVKLSFGSLPSRVSEGSTDETTVSITDNDDTQVSVSFEQSSYAVAEGGSVTVKVTLSEDPERTVTIPISRANQGGASNGDYSGVPANVTFNSGDTEKTFSFTATDDTADDDGESVKLSFGTLPARVSEGTTTEAVVSITDNDDPLVSVSFEQATYTVAEGDSVTVKVTLSADPERTVTIPISKANQGGASNGDYSGVPANVTFNSGDTEKTFSFTATDDTVDDDDESVKLSFGSLPSRVSEGSTDETTVSITDNDDTQVSVSFEQSSYTVAEGGSVTVKVTLSEDPERTVTIPIVAAAHGDATYHDYIAPVIVTFHNGETEAYADFNAVHDDIDEGDERVVLSFGTPMPERVSVGNPGMIGITIIDDDGDVSPIEVNFRIPAHTVEEGDTATIVVELSKPANDDLTVHLEVKHFNGIESKDYEGVPSSVTFPRGETTQSFTFTAMEDSSIENDEVAAIRFRNPPSMLRVGDRFGANVTIKDDDAPIQKLNLTCDNEADRIIILEAAGNLSERGERDFWRVALDPYKVYLIEVLGADSGDDVLGEDTYSGDLTLADPKLVAYWNADRSRVLGVFSPKVDNGRKGGSSIRPVRLSGPGTIQIEVASADGGAGTYQVKVRVNNVCATRDGEVYYPWFGGPDGYVLDDAADARTDRVLSTDPGPGGHPVSQGGFLGDNWDSDPDEDWYRIELTQGYEYTMELWTPTSVAVEHQARNLKILGIYDSNGVKIAGTSSSTSGRRVSVVFRPDTTGRYYLAVGSEGADRTGLYSVSAIGRPAA